MSVTLTQMRSKIRLRLADDGTTAGTTDATINSVINDRIQNLAGWMGKLRPDFFTSFDTITGVTDATDADDEYYALPSDFRTFKALLRRDSSDGDFDRLVELVEPEEQERRHNTAGRLANTVSGYSLADQSVAKIGSQIRIFRAPTSSSQVYRLSYLRTPATVSVDATALDIPDEFSEIIALTCTVFVLKRLGDPLAEAWAQELAQAMAVAERDYRNNVRGLTFGSLLEL